MPSTPPSTIERDVARAFLVTPPPEAEWNDIPASAQYSRSTAILGKCLLKVRDEQDDFRQRLEDLETRNLEICAQEWRQLSSSPISRTVNSSFFEAVDQKIQELPIDEIKEQGQALVHKVDELGDTIAENVGQLDERLDTLSAEIDDVDVRLGGLIEERAQELDTSINELGSRITIIEEAVQAQQRRHFNSLALRLWDNVHPITVIQDQNRREAQKLTPRRTVHWWWRLHNENRRSRLIEMLRSTGVDWQTWLQEHDCETDESDDEDDNLDPPAGPIPASTLEEAVSRDQRAAVIALFTHLGLDYKHFEELFAREKLRREAEAEAKPNKRPSSLPHHQRRTPQGDLRGPSYWGSPTEANTSIALGSTTESVNT